MKKAIKILALCLMSLSAMAQDKAPVSKVYVCPPCDQSCDDLKHDSPGICEQCNMVLIRQDLKKTIAFYLQDGVEVLDFAGPMEVFAYAGYEIFTVSANQQPITSQGILSVVPDYSIDNAPKADILAFFGGNAFPTSQNKDVIQWIKKQKDVQYFFSVCTGVFVLAEAGVLDSLTATTFHNALDNLTDNYPKIEVKKDVRYVDNGKVITTAGISAGIDGALHMVAKLQDLNAAKRTAYHMEYDNWQLGDGLVLTENNPYQTSITQTELKEFEGTYEYKNNSKFKLIYNAKSGDLNVIIDKVIYPIYHEDGDVFSDVRNEPVFFKRNKAKQVIGYSLSTDGKIFLKLIK